MTTYVNLPAGTTHAKIVQAITDARALGDADIRVSMAGTTMTAEEFLNDPYAEVWTEELAFDAMYWGRPERVMTEDGLAYFNRYVAGDR